MRSEINRPEMMKLLLVDDHAMMRTGLRQVVAQAFPDAEFGEAGSAREALDQVVRNSWDVVLLDIELPDRDGLDLLKDLRLAAPLVPVLILSGQPERDYGVQALKAGAAGFVAKTEVAIVLVDAIQKVCARGRHVSPLLAERLAHSLDPAGDRPLHDQLSAREFQILASLAKGQSVGDIAAQLSLSVKTVSTYRTRLLQKMGMKSNAELMRYALQHGLVR
jgi:two-component system, NarL family, invasion response regulator UvrY